MSIKIGKWVVICIGCAMALPAANSQEALDARYWTLEAFRVLALHDHFSSSVFRAWPGLGSREENLHAFFREHKLIGMSRTEVHKALGFSDKLFPRRENREAYHIVSLMLVDPTYLELQYTDDKVSGYRFRSQRASNSPFVASNPWRTR